VLGHTVQVNREHLLLVHDPAKHRCPLAVADVALHLVGPEDDLATLGGPLE
jgi:hypothetical protein